MNANDANSQVSFLKQVLDTAPPSGGKALIPAFVRGLIADILDTGEIEVVVPPDPDARIRCDFLETAGNTNLKLQHGDLVLVMLPAGVGQNGCVLGRVGRYRPASDDHVVIAANETLTLKCGDSSVDLRKDGKLMVRGNDVLTRAKRTNRIKGGSVAIN